jgi:S-adenosylmethionine:tRNA-ribosyltransferase-isomerase (queuine synthetase)
LIGGRHPFAAALGIRIGLDAMQAAYAHAIAAKYRFSS